MSVIDREHLTTVIIEGARKAFSEVRKQHPDKEFFGYCLYTDDSAGTFAHVVGHREEEWPSQDDDEYWNPHEWTLQDGLHHWDAVQSLIRDYQASAQDGDYDAFREGVFEAGVAALSALKFEGLFVNGTDVNPLYVVFSVSDWSEEEVFPWVQRLNSAETVDAYRRWMSAAAVPTTQEPLRAPDVDPFSNVERDFLCLAARGRLQELRELDGTSVRPFVVDEALVLAASKGRTDVCSFLLSVGAMPCHVGYAYKTALQFAEQERHRRVVSLLSEFAADDRQELDGDLRFACDRAIRHLLTVVIPRQQSSR